MSVPSGHFLSLPPSYASTSSGPSTSSHLSAGLAPNVASLASADFDVDVRTGFLPATKNLERLSAKYSIWEDALDASKDFLLGGGRPVEELWRGGIRSMPILEIDETSVTILRRAHVVLAFLAHRYAHTTPLPLPKPLPIPASISKPLFTVSALLGLPPVLTYADTVLWNFRTPDEGLPSLDNLPSSALTMFTGTSSEEQFYIVSAICEVVGADALALMRKSLDELFLADELSLKRLTVYLRRLATQIDRIGDVVLSVMQRVKPAEFYHLIRPWFNGGDSAGSAGWVYEGTDGTLPGENLHRTDAAGLMFSGPSAGQSSLIHAIDIFLTVDHTDCPDSGLHLNHDPINGPPTSSNESTFVQRMLQYMPLSHRSFLLHLSSHPNALRPVVVQHAETHPKLAAAYDSTLTALKGFREKHMRIVSLFIVQQARRGPPPGMHSGASTEEAGELRGTGGTPLFKFLKRCRDNTTRAMVGTKPIVPPAGQDILDQ